MIKSTQTQLENIVKEAIEYAMTVSVKFDTKFSMEEAVAALREAIDTAPIKGVEAKFVSMLNQIKEREYTGVITSVSDSGLCKIKLISGNFKSFYINNVRSITASGFTYVK